MADTRVLGAGDVARLVQHVGIDQLLDEMIDRLVDALSRHDPELIVTHDRSGYHYEKPALGLLEWMPALDMGRRVAIKTVGYHPTNPIQRRLPSVLATTSLYDTASGQLLLISEASFLTAIRTGAASAVASDVLCRRGPITLGVVGCGAQAVSQIHALSRVRTIERVLAFDTDVDNAKSLARRIEFLDIGVQVYEDDGLAELIGAVDVLCTCTSVDPGAGPVIPDVEHRPWLHVNAVGADFADKHELPLGLLDRALVCPDVVSQCLLEGESQQLDAADLGPDLSQLVRERGRYEAQAASTTVFDSTGWSLEDLVAVELVLEYAEQLGIGTMVDLQQSPADPYDPYGGFLRP